MALKLSNKHTAHLRDFLLNHEFDITIDFEDFGELTDLFVKVIGREPDDLR